MISSLLLPSSFLLLASTYGLWDQQHPGRCRNLRTSGFTLGPQSQNLHFKRICRWCACTRSGTHWDGPLHLFFHGIFLPPPRFLFFCSIFWQISTTFSSQINN